MLLAKIIVVVWICYFLYLYYENKINIKNRSSFKHIIHVNGTRGKSSSTRLIYSAISEEGLKVFCKTTGTSPMIIDTNNREMPIVRKNKANIKEQIKIIKMAKSQAADILVIECMAVNPELQYISQEKILKADIGVVTNVRRDHLEEMGPSLDDVAISLGNIMPKNGYFICGDERYMDYYKEQGIKNNTEVIKPKKIEDDHGIDFKDNLEIALEVCDLLNIPRDRAIKRMKNYKKDPGVLRIFNLEKKFPNTVFANGFAINDPDSIEIILDYLRERSFLDSRSLVLLVNNRGDRAYRMKQHIETINKLNPHKLIITGAYRESMMKKLIKAGYNGSIHIIDKVDEIEGIEKIENHFIYGIGNIVGHGEEFVKYFEEIGDEIV